jgi:hypothetical protein
MLIKPKQEMGLNLKLDEIVIQYEIQNYQSLIRLGLTNFLSGLTQSKLSCKIGLEL